MSYTDPLPKATVVPKEKGFSVVFGSLEIGASKLDCDARFHADFLNRLIIDVYARGCADTRQIMIEEFQKASEGK